MVERLDRAAAGKAGKRGHVRVLLKVMSKAVAQSNLVALTELMVKARGCQIEAVGIGKEPAIVFKLVDEEFVPRTGGGVDREDIGKNPSASCRRQRGLTGKAWNRRGAQGCKSVDNRNLIIGRNTLRPEDFGVNQQGDGVLRVSQQALEGAIQEGLVFGDEEAN